MSSQRHHNKKRRRKSAIQVFFDRLKGRDPIRSHQSSKFPGINMPDNYIDGQWHEKAKTERDDLEEKTDNDMGFAPNQPETPVNQTERRQVSYSPRRKKLFFGKLKQYFSERELRKEERIKEKIKREQRREAQKEYRKLNAGPGFAKKLLSGSDEMSEAEREKHVPVMSHRSPFYRNMTIAINSSLIFLVTYILTYLFYWLTCVLVASNYGIDSTLYFYDLKFNDHSPLWNRFNVLLITGIPPFFCLFLGTFLYKILFKSKRFAGLQKLFILWSSFHLFNHFFGAFPSGVITDEGFGYVAAWMYMNTAFKFMFALISLFVLGVIGFHSAKYILETSNSLHRIKSTHRLPFMFYQMVIPWFVGTAIMFLIRLPYNFDYPYETLMLFSTVFMVIPPLFNEKVKPEINLLKSRKKRKINIGYITLALIFIVFYRIILGIGLHFIIEINVSISPAIS